MVYLLLFLLFNNNQPSFVTFEQFGAKGKGADETAAIIKALNFAKERKLPIRLSGGIYKFSPTTETDITGIPAIEGTGTIDVSNTGPNAGYNSMTHVFTVRGTKELVKSGIAVKSGQNKIVLGAGYSLKKNDVLFITSSEALPNQRRPYNCRGQRAIVSAYDNNTGALTITDTFYFNINRAFFWKNTFIPEISVGENIKFITSKMNFLGCMQIIYGKANISGEYENFALAAISLRSSEGKFNHVKTQLPVTSNNGYSIGISIADMSYGVVTNCTMNGGRHNISGTGGGIWRKSESGGADEAAGYPSVMEVFGGIYKGTKNVNGISEDNGTVDSHGNVYKMTVRNCTIYGGLNLGADYAFIDNIKLFTDTKRAFNFGSDVLPGSDWGHYTITNSQVVVDTLNKKSIMLAKSDVNEIKLSNVIFEGIDENTLLADFRYPGPKVLKINEVAYEYKNMDSKPLRFLVNRTTDIQIKEELSTLKKEKIKRF
jgi:hypothetical protein